MKAIYRISYKSAKHETRENGIIGFLTNELLEKNTTFWYSDQKEVSLLNPHGKALTLQ